MKCYVVKLGIAYNITLVEMYNHNSECATETSQCITLDNECTAISY